MELRFADEELQRLYTDPKFTAKLPQGVVKAFRDLVRYIQQAVDERDFYNMKSLHYEKLKGGNGRNHSMRLNDQYRLLMEVDGRSQKKTVVILKVEDYH